MKKIISILGIIIISISPVYAAIIQVNPGDSIQAAITASSPGDIILLAKGTYVENITIPNSKTGLSIVGKGEDKTSIVSDGGNLNPKFAPPTVPADIIIDVFAAGVSISELSVVHPGGVTLKRDIGIFFRPPAVNGMVSECEIERNRTGNLEPTAPGSRGVLVFRATGVTIYKNDFEGNYEDHIHLPTSGATVIKNEVEDATRIGIAVIQESATTNSIDNVISSNEISDSGGDAIQIQGDNNIITDNEVEENNGAGIRLCGPTSIPSCAAPGGLASADNNTVTNNETEDNNGGNILDFGVNNNVSNNEEDEHEDHDD